MAASKLFQLHRPWECLPGDIFTVLLRHFHIISDRETLKNLRNVCRTWKQNTDSHLTHLSLQLNAQNFDWRISKTFCSLRSLVIHSTFDAASQNKSFLQDLSQLNYVKKLTLTFRGRNVLDEYVFLNKMKRLQEMTIDGTIFQQMRKEAMSLRNLRILSLKGCFKFNSQDYAYLINFPLLNRLVLTDVSPQWR